MSNLTASVWTAFGIAIGILAISALARLDTLRGGTQRVVDAVMASVAGTLIGVSVIFAGPTVRWLDFALALGLAGIAFAGMALHEVETWRANRELRHLHWLAPEAVPRGGRVAAHGDGDRSGVPTS